jgi:hypothetical protein
MYDKKFAGAEASNISYRQMAEWGMRRLQASFPRLKDRLNYEEKGEQQLILELIIYLYNYWASLVGLSQTQSVYMPWLQRSSNKFSPLTRINYRQDHTTIHIVAHKYIHYSLFILDIHLVVGN